MIKVIFFDVGGVLMKSEHLFENIYREFGEKAGIDPEESVRLHKKYLKQLIHGKISHAEFFAVLKSKAKKKKGLPELWVAIGLRHIKLDRPVLAIARRLKKKYKLAILSNLTQSREDIDRKLGIYNHFDALFLSHKIGMKKPSRNFYRHAMKKMKVGRGEALFIDDKERNVKAARKLGIHGIVFKNAAQLKKELAKLKVLY